MHLGIGEKNEVRFDDQFKYQYCRLKIESMRNMEGNRKILTHKSEIGRALLLYDKSLFWEYSESEIPKLGPELIVPRVTRYGTLSDIIRLFVIFPPDTIYDVVNKDRELDITEKAFLNSLNTAFNVLDHGDPFVKPEKIIDGVELTGLLNIGLVKLHAQNRRNSWKDLIDLDVITNDHPLSELLSLYNKRYPPWPKKQCFSSLVKNLETPPSLETFPHGRVIDDREPDEIISSLKKKCLEVYKSIFQEEARTIKSKLNKGLPIND